MPVQTQMASFAGKLGGRIAAANAEHREAPIDTGFRRLPPGIPDGVAKLVLLGTKVYDNNEKNAVLRGQSYFHATAVAVHPHTFPILTPNGPFDEKVAGTQMFLKVPLCDVPDNPITKKKGSTFSDNWFTFQNFFKCFGIFPPHEDQRTDPTGKKTEAYYMAAMASLLQRCSEPGKEPHFKFTTRGWTPPGPNAKEMTFEDWGEQCVWNGKHDPAAGVKVVGAGGAQPAPMDEPPPTHGPDGLANLPAGSRAPTNSEIHAAPQDEPMDLADEVAALVQVAMEDPDGASEDGAAAAKRLEELAWEVGWTKDQTAVAQDWAAVGDMALTAPDGAEGAGAPPTVGSRWKFCKRSKSGDKLRNTKTNEEFPAQDVIVVTVDEANQTCTLKTEKDNKDVVDIKSKKPVPVKWEWLEV